MKATGRCQPAVSGSSRGGPPRSSREPRRDRRPHRDRRLTNPTAGHPGILTGTETRPVPLVAARSRRAVRVGHFLAARTGCSRWRPTRPSARDWTPRPPRAPWRLRRPARCPRERRSARALLEPVQTGCTQPARSRRQRLLRRSSPRRDQQRGEASEFLPDHSPPGLHPGQEPAVGTFHTSEAAAGVIVASTDPHGGSPPRMTDRRAPCMNGRRRDLVISEGRRQCPRRPFGRRVG